MIFLTAEQQRKQCLQIGSHHHLPTWLSNWELEMLAPLSLCAFLLCPQATLPASPHFSVPVLSVPLTFSRDFFWGAGGLLPIFPRQSVCLRPFGSLASSHSPTPEVAPSACLSVYLFLSLSASLTNSPPPSVFCLFCLSPFTRPLRAHPPVCLGVCMCLFL